MRPSPRVALLTAATALLSAVGVLASHPATASTPVFGYGSPGFVVSAAPSTLLCSDCAGEPSVGVDWRTGAGLYMDGIDVLRLGFDNATSTVTWKDASPLFGLSANIDPILVTEPHSGVTLAGGDTGACSAMWASSDDGTSWLPSVPCTGTYDHPTVGYSPSAMSPGTTVYYYCQQGPLEDHCATSTTAGTAWVPAGPTSPLTCFGLHGHLRGSTDGTAYLPSKSCFDAQSNVVVGGLKTNDDGLTWNEYTIPGTANAGFDPAVATTPDNTVYEAWERSGSYHPMVAVSKTHGDSWATPVDLAGTVSPPLVASTFPSLVAGDNGRVAYSFLGSSVGSGDPNTSGFHGVWYPYTSYTYDGGATWTTVRDTSTPVQYGEVDSGGTTTSGQRNLLDFIDSSLTKDGRVLVGFADGCLADCETKGAAGDQAGAETLSTHAWATVAYQTSGRGLLSQYDVNPPAAPTLAVTSSGTSAQLTWSTPAPGSSPITGYQVLRGTAAGGESLLTTVTGTSYADSGLTAGQTYSYEVTAVNAVGTSLPSNEVSISTTTPPAAPTASAVATLNGVNLAWTPPADGGSPITGYVVKRGTATRAETALATLGAVTSYADTAVTPGVAYFYTLQAVNAVGTSAGSAEVSATPYTTASAPVLVATAGKGLVTLTWTAPNDGGKPITGYQIYRGLAPGAEGLVQTISTGTTYVDPGLVGGTTYFYRVAAVTSVGTGALSNEVAAVPKRGA